MKVRLPTLFLIVMAAIDQSRADPLDDARRLLRVTDVGEKFELAVQKQTSDIIRTYESIVVMSTELELPVEIKQEIERCYLETFAWQNFETGIAQLFADNLDEDELRLLLDFYRDRSVPPPQIGRFRELIARADAIEQLALDYMFRQAGDCEQKNVNLILSYLAGQTGATNVTPK